MEWASLFVSRAKNPPQATLACLGGGSGKVVRCLSLSSPLPLHAASIHPSLCLRRPTIHRWGVNSSAVHLQTSPRPSPCTASLTCAQFPPTNRPSSINPSVSLAAQGPFQHRRRAPRTTSDHTTIPPPCPPSQAPCRPPLRRLRPARRPPAPTPRRKRSDTSASSATAHFRAQSTVRATRDPVSRHLSFSMSSVVLAGVEQSCLRDDRHHEVG